MSRWTYDGGLSTYDEYDDEGEYLDEEYSIYEQCCRNCRFFSMYRGYGECRNPNLDEFDSPSAKGDDCCDLWEERRSRR